MEELRNITDDSELLSGLGQSSQIVIAAITEKTKVCQEAIQKCEKLRTEAKTRELKIDKVLTMITEGGIDLKGIKKILEDLGKRNKNDLAHLAKRQEYILTRLNAQLELMTKLLKATKNENIVLELEQKDTKLNDEIAGLFTPEIPTRDKPFNIFISYASEDQENMDEVRFHLDAIADELVHIWTDQDIDTGANWRTVLGKAIKKTHVAIFLASTNSLSKKFTKLELKYFLQLQGQKKAKIIGIILSECAWQATQLSEIQMFGKTSKTPLNVLSEQERKNILIQLVNFISSLR